MLIQYFKDIVFPINWLLIVGSIIVSAYVLYAISQWIITAIWKTKIA